MPDPGSLSGTGSVCMEIYMKLQNRRFPYDAYLVLGDHIDNPNTWSRRLITILKLKLYTLYNFLMRVRPDKNRFSINSQSCALSTYHLQELCSFDSSTFGFRFDKESGNCKHRLTGRGKRIFRSNHVTGVEWGMNLSTKQTLWGAALGSIQHSQNLSPG